MKFKKGNLLIDITISLMFISTVVFVCYTTATTAINKRYQVSKERDALMIAENIMNRVLATGFNHIDNNPVISKDKIDAMNAILSQNIPQKDKNQQLVELGCRIPVDASIGGDAPFLQNKDAVGNSKEFSYQLMVEPYRESYKNSKGEVKYFDNLNMSKVTVNVYYPIKISMFNNSEEDLIDPVSDKISLEEDYRVVTLSTFKTAREYTTEK